MGCHFLLLQGIFRTQDQTHVSLHWQADSSPVRHLGSPVSWADEGIKKKQPLPLLHSYASFRLPVCPPSRFYAQGTTLSAAPGDSQKATEAVVF